MPKQIFFCLLFAGEASPLYKRLLDDELINQSFGYEYFEEMGYRAVIFAAETRFPERVAEIIKQAAEELHKKWCSERGIRES